MRVQALLTVAACLALTYAANAQDTFTNGLVAYYPFNGNANDESGNGNNGTVKGAVLAADRFGKTNSAYSFDGISSLIAVPDASSLKITNDITVTCWLNFSQTNSKVRFVGKGGDCGRNYGLWNDTQTWMFQQFPPEGGCVGCQENTLSATPVMQSAKWYQLVGVRSNGVSRLYLDGALIAERAPTCSGNTYTGTEPLLFGAFDDPVTDPRFNVMQGKLDDIRIYNRALSGDEVQQLYFYEKNPLPDLSIAVKTIRLSLFVKVGTTNQIETSSNLTVWADYGSPFVATNSIQYQDVDIFGTAQRFFRIRQIDQ